MQCIHSCPPIQMELVEDWVSSEPTAINQFESLFVPLAAAIREEFHSGALLIINIDTHDAHFNSALLCQRPLEWALLTANMKCNEGTNPRPNIPRQVYVLDLLTKPIIYSQRIEDELYFLETFRHRLLCILAVPFISIP